VQSSWHHILLSCLHLACSVSANLRESEWICDVFHTRVKSFQHLSWAKIIPFASFLYFLLLCINCTKGFLHGVLCMHVLFSDHINLLYGCFHPAFQLPIFQQLPGGCLAPCSYIDIGYIGIVCIFLANRIWFSERRKESSAAWFNAPVVGYLNTLSH
jgi:hypothetical protein